ncbi:MAG: DUF4249 family protein, partial [Bacteroidota bacterium]
MKIPKNIFRAFLFLMVIGLFSSCDDVVDVDLDDATPTFSVDAFLTDQDKVQEIKLYFSQGYFDNSPFRPASDATVLVLNTTSGVAYDFIEMGNTGAYRWESTSGEVIGQVGDTFELTITHEGRTYTATSTMNRVPVIDDIIFSLQG